MDKKNHKTLKCSKPKIVIKKSTDNSFIDIIVMFHQLPTKYKIRKYIQFKLEIIEIIINTYIISNIHYKKHQ